MILNPGTIDVISAKVFQPARGVWSAELELDPQLAAQVPPAGPVTLTIGALPGPVVNVTGVLDPRGTGPFVSLFNLRMLGGAGGWDKSVPRQSYNADGGLLTAQVYAATGAIVGERVTTLVPAPITAFLVTKGPASRVLNRETSWWVDPTTGTTFVGPRPPAVPDPSLTLIYWHADAQVAELTCDTLVAPGTPIVDPRIGAAPVFVREVEQVFDRSGSKVTAWCGASPAVTVAKDLRSLVEEFSGIAYARSYKYTVVLQNAADGRLTLQAAAPADGVPDTMSITPWGAPGVSAKYKLGASVRVAFFGGDPSRPIVDLSDATVPLEATLDGSVAVHVGPSAPTTDIGGGKIPLVLAPWALGLSKALTVFAQACEASTTDPVLKAAAIVLFGALGLLPAPATTGVTSR